MAISMFSSSISPIAIDFGSASVKMLQLSAGPKPTVIAVAEYELPNDARNDQSKRMAALSGALPSMFRKGKFKGKRVCFSIPSSQTFVTHLPVPMSGTDAGDYVGMYLHAQTGVPPENMVIRTSEVKDVYRNGAAHKETICFAVPREVVMQHIDLLKKCKMEVVGVHTEQHAIVWAFNHIHQRKGDDEITNLLIDIGWGGTKVGISHGKELVFAKSIHIGGREFDQHAAEALRCDVAEARSRRIESATPLARAARPAVAAMNRHAGPGEGDNDGGVATREDLRTGALPNSLAAAGSSECCFGPDGADLCSLLEVLVDELKMCVRYHRSLFESRPINRVIFMGGETRDIELCRAIASALNLQAVIGDPLGRMSVEAGLRGSVVKEDQVMPGWTVACGLLSDTDEI